MSKAMTLDGNRYTADLPAQNNGTVVEYWVTAIDSAGGTKTSPSGRANNRYLYVVTSNQPAPGAVVINEIMYNGPDTLQGDFEWIELFNPGASAVNIAYWKLRDDSDNHEFVFPAGLSIAPKGYLLIADEKDPRWTGPVLTGLPFGLGDNGDSVRLFDPNDRLISSVSYNDNNQWPRGADGEGGSLELLQSNRPSEESNNWAVSPNGGTPGKVNARAITDANYYDFNIVINEIFYHPPDEEYGGLNLEFIELHNRGTATVDVSGWSFTTGVEYTFSPGTVISGGGYLLVCKDRSRYPSVSNKTGDFFLALDNGGEAIALTNRAGVVIDYVDYGDEYPWPARPDGEGVSLELTAPFGDNAIAQNWASGEPMSPGVQNSHIVSNTPPRITDLGHTPVTPTATSQQQDTDFSIVVNQGDTWRYFKGTEEPPSDWNSVDFSDTAWEQGPSGIGYGDGDDATVLSDMQGNFLSVYMRRAFTLTSLKGITQLLFAIDFDDSYVAYLNGVEIARNNVSGSPPRYNDSADGNHGASVDDGQGAIDDIDVSAFIENLRVGRNVLAVQGHNVDLGSSDFTLIPLMGIARTQTSGEEDEDSIVISTQVRDEDGVTDVLLNYQRLSVSSGQGLFLDDWKTAPMFDDGTHGDLVPGDGRYAVVLNELETIQPDEIWRYYISARDGKGAWASRPIQDDLTRDRLIYVKNGSESDGGYPTVRLFMEQSKLAFLTRNPDTNDEQPCILVVDGEAIDLYNGGGVRFRGEGSGDLKKSWKIQFPRGDRLHGKRVVNLNANNHTTPLLDGESGFLEHLAYGIFNKVGLPAPETRHVRLMLNGEYHGLYLEIEQPNEDFLENHNLPDDTQVYRAGVGSRRATLAVESDPAVYSKIYENEIGKENDVQTLVDFIEAMNSATDPKAFFERNFNVEQYINYLAAVALTTQYDSIEKNYLPVRTADGRWSIYPNDAQDTWGLTITGMNFPLNSEISVLDGSDVGSFYGINALRKKFLSVPEYRQRYYDRLLELTDTLFTPEALNPVVDAYWSYLQNALLENQQRWNAQGQLSQMASQVKAYISARRDFIRSNTDIRPADRPAQPVNTSPANGTAVTQRALTLQVNTPGQGSVTEAQWRIQLDGQSFESPVWTTSVSSGASTQVQVPATALGAGSTYQWNMRWKLSNGTAWSDWSSPTRFTVNTGLAAPDVVNARVSNLDGAAILEWDPIASSDVIRVDVYNSQNVLVESTPRGDHRVRINQLINGITYRFTIRTVTADRKQSAGVSVTAAPTAPPAYGSTIAYFRFENNLNDEAGRFFTGKLLGAAAAMTPGAENPVPLTGAPNNAALDLSGHNGDGFQFGGTEPALDARRELTMECYAKILNSEGPAILLDRYDELNAANDGVWRFGVGLTQPGALEFFFNDGDRNDDYTGRLHVSSAAGAVPDDGAFHHYAAVLDLNAAGVLNRVRLYIDGVRKEVRLIHAGDGANFDELRVDSDLPVLVGARRLAGVGTADVVEGAIDEVRLTLKALQSDQFLHPVQPGVTEWSLY
ncbi:MAG: hypothetical protein GC154_17890 [bacterium]|nr:hypothetical protein [bacterium]